MPYAGVIQDAQGNLYGTTYSGGANNGGIIYKIASSGAETILYSFGATSGLTRAGVVMDSAGNLYGTIPSGPTNDGVVYKLSPEGTQTILHAFTGPPDGSTPFAGVILDSAGNVYGTTFGGGASFDGTVYEVDTAGNETVLYSFQGGADGTEPQAGLVRDSSGNLYGTMTNGGTANEGQVYEVAATGQKSVLYSFPAMADGAIPLSGLIGDAEGNFYGTTWSGGTWNAGIVYKLTRSGDETVLYTFTGGADGGKPLGNLARDSAGNLYGTTFSGGGGEGVVYRLDPAGQETVLHAFGGSGTGLDGGPEGGVILDSAGNLYGTTSGGGEGFGTVFQLDPAGNQTVLFSFNG